MESLKKELSSVSIERWFLHIQPSKIQEDVLILDAPDDFFKNWILDHYKEHLDRAVSSLGTTVKNIEIHVSQTRETPKTQEAPTPLPTPTETSQAIAHKVFLNPRYTFEDFVMGPSNRFSLAACVAVSEQPAKAYNPLFIHGPVGLGKTHLMQGIGNAVRKRNPNANILYITSEKFTNELINAIQNRNTLKFREKFRKVDILLIDDIHFIGGKEATQEEFFHTFNTLHDDHKQIVISSDRPPKEINNLEERLVSRFEWGLITDIQPADFETRAAILKKKAERDHINVPDSVIFFIAEKVQSNIRELEGALIRVVAYSHLIGRPITEGLAHEALKTYIKEMEKKITIQSIQKVVAEFYNLKISDLITKRRTKNIVLPRQVAMFLARELTELSLPEIGQAFGGRDHTTVLHAREKIKSAVDNDVNIREAVIRLRKDLVG